LSDKKKKEKSKIKNYLYETDKMKKIIIKKIMIKK